MRETYDGTPRFKLIPVSVAGAGVAAALAFGFDARADGVPNDKALWYSGTVSDEAAHALLEDEHSAAFRVFLAGTGGTPLCKVAPEAKLSFAHGRFRLDVSASRETFAKQPDVFVELSVDDPAQLFARTKLGAVPYALEAARSSAATGALADTLARLACEVKRGAWDPTASIPCAQFLQATTQKVAAQDTYRTCSAEFGSVYGPATRSMPWRKRLSKKACPCAKAFGSRQAVRSRSSRMARCYFDHCQATRT